MPKPLRNAATRIKKQPDESAGDDGSVSEQEEGDLETPPGRTVLLIDRNSPLGQVWDNDEDAVYDDY